MNRDETRCAIFVVEDDPFDLALLKNALSMLGVDDPVIAFSDGAALIHYLDPAPAIRVNHASTKPGIILLDLKMPGMDGFEVIERLRQHPWYANIPIIVISGLTSPKEIARAMELGADDFLVKPVDPPTLDEILSEFCPELVAGQGR
jgi:two-component system, sensor histidine kinase and response regulator